MDPTCPCVNPGRVTQIDVWDKAQKAYVPLERLKLYTLATDNYFCLSFDLFPTFAAGRFKGETAAVVTDGTVQGPGLLEDTGGRRTTSRSETSGTRHTSVATTPYLEDIPPPRKLIATPHPNSPT